ncbi:tRNA adenosine(34) deaminase TadA [Buchnera aphidicola (Mindarus keteleerifoliae)]|uniref:tRNA adenosine(34) deaminase TadA n=1 Tax=Buchnera aphidicola TaxID=9 RepID=UPI0031B6B767
MKFKKKDEYWMKYSLKLAKLSEKNREIPVGAILILNDKIIGKGFNSSIKNNDPTAHAEIVALRSGSKKIKNYRLLNTTLYVTLEPCIMCLGAIIHSRINRLVFGTKNNRQIINIKDIINYKKKFNQIKNLDLQNKCSIILKNFFCKKRKNKK